MGSNLDQGRIDVCRQKFKHSVDHFNKQTVLLLLSLLLLLLLSLLFSTNIVLFLYILF